MGTLVCTAGVITQTSKAPHLLLQETLAHLQLMLFAPSTCCLYCSNKHARTGQQVSVMPGVAWGMSLTAIRSAEVCFTSWRARLVSTRQPASMSARATSHPLYQKGTTTCLQHLSTWRGHAAKYGQQASGHARAESGMWTQTPTVDFRPLDEAFSAPASSSAPASKAAYDCTHEKDGLEDGLSRCAAPGPRWRRPCAGGAPG